MSNMHSDHRTHYNQHQMPSSTSNNSEIDNLSNGSNNSKRKNVCTDGNIIIADTPNMTTHVIQDSNNRLPPSEKQPSQQQIIAKPLASRPAPPFLHHSLSHPHLHSLLAHCRGPYIGAGELIVNQ